LYGPEPAVGRGFHGVDGPVAEIGDLALLAGGGLNEPQGAATLAFVVDADVEALLAALAFAGLVLLGGGVENAARVGMPLPDEDAVGAVSEASGGGRGVGQVE